MDTELSSLQIIISINDLSDIDKWQQIMHSEY